MCDRLLTNKWMLHSPAGTQLSIKQPGVRSVAWVSLEHCHRRLGGWCNPTLNLYISESTKHGASQRGAPAELATSLLKVVFMCRLKLIWFGFVCEIHRDPLCLELQCDMPYLAHVHTSISGLYLLSISADGWLCCRVDQDKEIHHGCAQLYWPPVDALLHGEGEFANYVFMTGATEAAYHGALGNATA
jgi:hypothetical protein